MNDIAPELLDRVWQEFQKQFDNDKTLSDLAEKLEKKTATHMEAYEYAGRVGDILTDAYHKHISADGLPDGKMWYNIASRVVTPTMKNNYDIIAKYVSAVQENLNRAAGLHIKVIKPELNDDRIRGIVDKLSNADNYTDVEWVLGAPIGEFGKSIVDDFIRTNVDFHGKAGLKPKIIRKSSGDCCKWCSSIAGTYIYPDVPKDVYRRHSKCNCTVEYDPGDGSRQNVHTKRWQTQDEYDKIEKRKSIGLDKGKKEIPQDKERRINTENDLGLAEKIMNHPKMFQAYTPKGLKKALEKAGYKVKPLSKGKYGGVSFEDGGGFKVNFGGDGILQYHPEKGSHHGGAYYKISTGKGGIKHYDINGEEKED